MNKRDLIRYASNMIGWSTKRKIVVIESDDWGSIYQSSNNAHNALEKSGLSMSSHYLTNDALESNSDLESLFEVLSNYKDCKGNCPVFTAVSVVANPDFDKIEKSNFQQYHYEDFTTTCKRYPFHDKVFDLWLEGISKKIFVPSFHGREHLNVRRWMKLLQDDNKAVRLAFEYGLPAITFDFNNKRLPDLRAAFDIDDEKDIEFQKQIIISGLDLFENLCGYRSAFFIPTNGPFSTKLEAIAANEGIKFIGTGKVNLEPLGDDLYKKSYRWLGKKNKIGQIYLTRNCFFEPNSWEHNHNKDWVNDCLSEIGIAFNCRKPATISSHRTNYIGWLHPENRSNGLLKLTELLKQILQRWPDVEFMTSCDLGNIIELK